MSSPIANVDTPLSSEKKSSVNSVHRNRISIKQKLQNETEKEISPQLVEKLPKEHYSDLAIKENWKLFLKKIKNNPPNGVDVVALGLIQIEKNKEEGIRISYPSAMVRHNFDLIQSDFMEELQLKLHHFGIEIEFFNEKPATTGLAMTKREIFEQMASENPNIQALHNFLRFDFS